MSQPLVQDFIKSVNSDDNLHSTTKILQTLVSSNNLTLDPKSIITSEFFAALHKLFLSPFGSSGASIPWLCVNLLQNICRNNHLRLYLIESYDFVSCLASLLSDEIHLEKKVKVLKVLQQLTYGVKIDWQWPCLPNLFTTLSHWIESRQDDQDVITLSFAILVNLCHKNLPALYCLSANVEMSRFLRICMRLNKGALVDSYICILLVIFDYKVLKNISSEHLVEFVNKTFNSIKSGLQTKDCSLLGPIIDFFNDTASKNNLQFYENYQQQIGDLLNQIESSKEDCTECIRILYKFFQILLELNILPSALYKQIVQNAIKSIHIDSSAIIFLRKLIEKSSESPNCCLELINNNNVIGSIINIFDEPDASNKLDIIGASFELLKASLIDENCKMEILNRLQVETVNNILFPVNGDDFLSTNINFNVQGIALIAALGKIDERWLAVHYKLQNNLKIHRILVEALYNSPDSNIRYLVIIELIPLFSKKLFIQSLPSPLKYLPSSSDRIKNIETSCSQRNEIFPIISRLSKIDEILNTLKYGIQTNAPISSSQIIELYESRLMVEKNSKFAAEAIAKGASEHTAKLQQENEMLNRQLNEYHKILFHSEQCLEFSQNAKIILSDELEKEKNNYKVCKRQLKQKEETVIEYKKRIDELQHRTDEIVEKNEKLTSLVSKLETTAEKLEKNLEKKDNIIEKLKLKINELEGQFKEKETELRDLTVDFNRIKDILRQVTEVAGQRNPR